MDRKKFHQLPHTHPQSKFLSDGFGSGCRNARHLRQPMRFPFQHFQGTIPKMADDAGSAARAHTLNDPAGKILQDRFAGGGQHPLQKFRLKLAAITIVARPTARDHQALTHRRHGNGAHDGNRLGIAAFEPQDCITIVVVLKNNGDDGSLQHFHFLVVKGHDLLILPASPGQKILFHKQSAEYSDAGKRSIPCR